MVVQMWDMTPKIRCYNVTYPNLRHDRRTYPNVRHDRRTSSTMTCLNSNVHGTRIAWSSKCETWLHGYDFATWLFQMWHMTEGLLAPWRVALRHHRKQSTTWLIRIWDVTLHLFCFGDCLVRSVLQCVAVCCSVLQCVAVCCSVLQIVAVCCRLSSTIREKNEKWSRREWDADFWTLLWRRHVIC